MVATAGSGTSRGSPEFQSCFELWADMERKVCHSRVFSFYVFGAGRLVPHGLLLDVLAGLQWGPLPCLLWSWLIEGVSDGVKPHLYFHSWSWRGSCGTRLVLFVPLMTVLQSIDGTSVFSSVKFRLHVPKSFYKYLTCGHVDVVCTWSIRTLRCFASWVAVVGIMSNRGWSDADTGRSKIVWSCCCMNTPLLTKSCRLSKLESVLTFMMWKTIRIHTFVGSVLHVLIPAMFCLIGDRGINVRDEGVPLGRWMCSYPFISGPSSDRLVQTLNECSYAAELVLNRSTAYRCGPECLRVFDSDIAGRLFEINDVHVGLGDDVGGCVGCRQKLIDFKIWCRFLLLTCSAHCRQAGMRVEGAFGGFWMRMCSCQVTDSLGILFVPQVIRNMGRNGKIPIRWEP